MKTGFKFLLITLFCLASANTLACNVIGKKEITKNMNLSYSRGSILTLENEDQYGDIQMVDCRKASGDYLLIRSGYRYPGHLNNLFQTVYADKVHNLVCEKESANFKFANKSYSFKNRLSDLLKIQKSCISYKVSEKGGKPLIFDENQKNCEIKRIGPSEALVTIGDCFFDVNMTNSFKIETVVNKQCLDRNYLKENNLNPTAFTAQLDAFIYETPFIDGMFDPKMDLAALTTEVDLETDGEIFETDLNTTKFGEPLNLPSTYYFPEIHISKINLRKFGRSNNSTLKINLLVDSTRKEKCVDGLCSSENNYELPIAGELFIYDVTGGRKNLIHSGHIGGVAKGQWQGTLVTGAYLRDVLFEKGKDYLFKLSFSDPYYDFYSLKNSLKRMIGSIESNLSSGRVAGRDFLRGLNNINEINGFGSLNLGGDILTGIPEDLFNVYLSIAGKYNSNITFPPAYAKVCSNKGTNCRKARYNDHVTMTANFKVKEVTRRGEVVIENLKIGKKSKIGESYSPIKMDKLPTITCENK